MNIVLLQMEPTLAATLIGILATSQIHIAKGMQKYGISIFHFTPGESGSYPRSRRKRNIYIGGIILNNLAFLWAIVANIFAPTSYYTSAFGFGLVVLMVFSELFLHEKHTALQHFGAVVIAAGTLLIGMGRHATGIPGMEQINSSTVVLFIAVYFPVLLVLLLSALISHTIKPLGVIFGLITGGAAAIDPILKGIGQNAGMEMKLLPVDGQGWLYFAGSFIFGAVAFSFTQFGFFKKARASTLVAFHNITLITVPILLMKISLPGFFLTRSQIMGLSLVLIGIGMMFFKPRRTDL